MSNVLIVAPKNDGYDKLFNRNEFRDYSIQKQISELDEVLPYLCNCKKEGSLPEDILIVEGTTGKSTTTNELMISIRKEFPEIRQILFAGEVSPNDPDRCGTLGTLVKAGIYDIVIGAKVTGAMILKSLNELKDYDDVKYLTAYKDTSNGGTKQESIRNIVSCYSVKPGSGKTMLAVNLAAAIAKFGQSKRNGKSPRVAVIEGNLSHLSVGSVLHLENQQYNLREALRLAVRAVDQDGKMIVSGEKAEETKNAIRRCFVKCPGIPNLYALVSSELEKEEIKGISPLHYQYVLESICGAFDVVIADMSSLPGHLTADPLFRLSSRIYLILNPDYSNLQANIRFRKELDRFNIQDKVSYILNKDIDETTEKKMLQDLDYDPESELAPGMGISHRIPYTDPVLLANDIYKGMPVVLDKDPAVKEMQNALLEIANEIWKLDGNKVKEYYGKSRKKLISFRH